MNIQIQTKIDARKRAAVMAVIQDLEEKPTPKPIIRDRSNPWIRATKVRKRPEDAS